MKGDGGLHATHARTAPVLFARQSLLTAFRQNEQLAAGRGLHGVGHTGRQVDRETRQKARLFILMHSVGGGMPE